jgi:hypothetical protein
MTSFDYIVGLLVGGVGAWAWIFALSWLPVLVR